MSTLELDRIGKHFGITTAVRDLSLSVASGEFVALLGPSGCGKTTTLQIIAGFVEPSEGEIRIDGRDVTGVPPHQRNVGVVFQSYALFPHLTVFGNVAFGLQMRRKKPADIKERVRRALDIVRLGRLEERYPRELSGGQQQRVALARALVIEPTLLLLDEPLFNLDAQLREQMRFEIRQIQRRTAITTVFVTHDLGEAMAAADRLVVMSGGCVRQVGTAREIYEDPADLFVAGFIGQANLIPVRIRTVSGDEALCGTDGGLDLVARHRGDLRPQDAGVLMLRPDDIQLADAPPRGGNSIPGIVSHATYLGGVTAIGVKAKRPRVFGRGAARQFHRRRRAGCLPVLVDVCRVAAPGGGRLSPMFDPGPTAEILLGGAPAQDPRSGAPELVFVGDLHGMWHRLEEGLRRTPLLPKSIILLVDIECDRPLDELAAPILRRADRAVLDRWQS